MNIEKMKIIFGIVICVLAVTIFLGSFFLYPVYNVWASEMSGKAQLKEAEWNRQIAVQEAQAEKDSATLKKEADIIRAEGIAESNRIIASSLTPEYITWKWVEGLNDGNSEVIYIPTEANLPILKARG